MLYKLSDFEESKLEQKAGIYAFYFKPKIATYDLYKNDDDNGCEELIKLVDDKFIKPLNSKDYSNNIDLGYESKLTGNLQVKNKSIRGRRFYNSVTENRFSVEQVFSNYHQRAAFKDIMDSLGGLFSAPIYVGVSHNISERVCQHRDSYYESLELLNRSAQVNDNDFGARAAQFATDEELLVTAHYFDSEQYSLNKKQAFELAILSEWVVHQQYRPLLGKK